MTLFFKQLLADWGIAEGNSFFHSHGSRTWQYLKSNYYWGDPFFTSLIMGGRVSTLCCIEWPSCILYVLYTVSVVRSRLGSHPKNLSTSNLKETKNGYRYLSYQIALVLVSLTPFGHLKICLRSVILPFNPGYWFVVSLCSKATLSLLPFGLDAVESTNLKCRGCLHHSAHWDFIGPVPQW